MFQLKIDTNSAAFEENPGLEVARILSRVADDLEFGMDYSHFVTLRDINGNDVGRAKLADSI
jgi:hypothetical protein